MGRHLVAAERSARTTDASSRRTAIGSNDVTEPLADRT
jgi:hypothetical protein